MGVKVAVLGTGNVGASLAGVLTLAGVDVSLGELPAFEDSLHPIIENGGIDVKGAFGVGLAKPSLMTSDVGDAIRGRKILLFCHPAYAHEAFTRACAPFLEDEQNVRRDPRLQYRARAGCCDTDVGIHCETGLGPVGDGSRRGRNHRAERLWPLKSGLRSRRPHPASLSRLPRPRLQQFCL